jgi:hypothetical protein
VISSWKDFLLAVDKMRQCQKDYARTKSPAAHNAAKKREAEVDACIKQKRETWAALKQPELSLED